MQSQKAPSKKVAPETTESGADITNKAAVDTQVSRKAVQVSWDKTESNFEREIARPKRRLPSNAAGKFLVKPKWAFTRNVLHYVPKRKKCQNKFAKSGTKKIDKYQEIKNVDWPRRSVSLPTDFVHVAGITRWSWLKESNLSAHSARVITHAEKCATLTLIGDNQDACSRSSSLETLVNDIVAEPVKQPQQLVRQIDEFKVSLLKPQANTSFLWSNIAKCSNVSTTNDIEEYDDVGSFTTDMPVSNYLL